jgi:mannose-6-phosphate isomerase-like protein (cupin superfamily)
MPSLGYREEVTLSIFIPKFERSAVVRNASAEVVGAPNVKVKLLADSSATGGALSTVRITLDKGADGAKPHHHTRSAEMFYVLDGRVDVLSGREIVKAEAGDVIVVPPLMAHAFAAERGSNADILIIIAPGVERFEYFRQLTRIARGEEKPESLKDLQDMYDNFFLNSPEWEARE